MRWTQNRDLNSLLDAVVEAGWMVDRTRGNHLREVSSRGSVVTVATTPSDYRAVLNTRARIRRISKQEQQL
jgi:predicted RNA binding protein YcfA (HicA-like mRNA interferase family)